jgi:hypothetical protein
VAGAIPLPRPPSESCGWDKPRRGRPPGHAAGGAFSLRKRPRPEPTGWSLYFQADCVGDNDLLCRDRVFEMLAPLPYSDLVGSQDPLSLLASTPARITELVRTWDAARWSRTYAPGKWTAAQLVLHLAQDEIGWCNRVRLALTVDGYVVQPYDGADWVARETASDPAAALAAYRALRRLNLLLYERIPADRRARRFSREIGEGGCPRAPRRRIGLLEGQNRVSLFWSVSVPAR